MVPPAQVREYIGLARSRDGICGGRILSVPGGRSNVADDERHATWVGGGEVRLAWEIGGPRCRGSYSGLPPLVLEGRSAVVDALERVLR